MGKSDRSRRKSTVISTLWTVLAVIVAAVILRAAIQKLMGVPAALEPFQEFGWPTWTIYLTAAGEIVGSIALIIPRTRPFGGLLLTLIMIGAAFTNFANGHPEYVILNAVLIAGSLLLVWQSRENLRLPSGHGRQAHGSRLRT